jgi:predicted GH43/DUF377 family glycosyl hydrolase
MNRQQMVLALALALLATSHAFSQTSWQRYEGNPVLIPKADWEAGGNINNTVVKIGNEYKHWFTGIGNRFRIGIATSTDGIHWQKSNANPVLDVGTPGEFDSEHVYNPMVVYHDGLYWMWYAGNNGTNWQIGLATSIDGVQWKKHPNNPVLKIGAAGKWDDKHLTAPFVMRDGTVFKMWYRGESAQFTGKGSTGYAESPDGINWERYSGNPVFGPAPSGWDSRSLSIYPILRREGKYEGWYAGSDGSTSQLGYVTSLDGINWQRYPNNPVMSPTRNNSWDGEQISSPFVLFEKNVYKMWYSGFGSSGWRIGYATSQTTITPASKRFVYIPRIYGLPGDTITVTLFADTVSAISGGDVTILFDAEVLKAVRIQSTKYTRDFLIAANLDTPGVARVSLASARAAVGGGGGLFNIKMFVNPALPLPSTPQPRPLKLAHTAFYAENGKLIPLNKRDGEFILGRSRGDVNRDGRINAADAILALRIAAGLFIPTPNQLADADIDGNGRVESLDASCMLKRAVGLDCPTGGASNIAANLLISPFHAGAGNQVETRLSVNGIDKLLGGDVSLRFDANALEITDIQPSPELEGAGFVANFANSGQINFSFAAANGFQAKTIAVVKLRAKTPIDEKSLRATEMTFFDAQGRRWKGVLTSVNEARTSSSPAQFRLEQNYPNPFYLRANSSGHAGQTQIRYALPQTTNVKLAVYDLNGRLVRLLEDAEKPAGEHAQIWDGFDENKTPAAAGFYLYRLQAGQITSTRKLLLLP